VGRLPSVAGAPAELGAGAIAGLLAAAAFSVERPDRSARAAAAATVSGTGFWRGGAAEWGAPVGLALCAAAAGFVVDAMEAVTADPPDVARGAADSPDVVALAVEDSPDGARAVEDSPDGAPGVARWVAPAGPVGFSDAAPVAAAFGLGAVKTEVASFASGEGVLPAGRAVLGEAEASARRSGAAVAAAPLASSAPVEAAPPGARSAAPPGKTLDVADAVSALVDGLGEAMDVAEAPPADAVEPAGGAAERVSAGTAPAVVVIDGGSTDAPAVAGVPAAVAVGVEVGVAAARPALGTMAGVGVWPPSGRS
jgi:hypothetical protein